MITHKMLNEITHIAFEAGKIILQYFKSPFSAHHKTDGSPVTNADIQANRFIVDALLSLTPSIPIISEEGKNESLSEKTFWCVDPLDGTKQFIKGKEEFTVNIGLIHKGSPLLGVILQPTTNFFVKGMPGLLKSGYYPNDENADSITTDERLQKIIYLGTDYDVNEQFQSFLKSYHLKNTVTSIVRSSLKFCYVAIGRGDYIFRSRPCCEWDIAAGHALLKARGGNLFSLESNQEIVYGTKDFIVPNFIASRC